MKRFLFVLITTFFLVQCAKKGRPNGGPKDENAPVFVIANPPYKSTNFKGNEIKLSFDEYVILKDLNKQLVVSPPMKNQPVISPQGTASKEITIKIVDTLKTNTTYTFNFGNAIQDNNEGNKLDNFKYVFSTGNYIDSLQLKGKVRDATEFKIKDKITVMLYKIDSTYNDSIIYKKKPNYVTFVSDSTSGFTFENLHEGNYKIITIKDQSKDYIFDPKNDKIGFLTDTISLPKDSILLKELVLFREIQPYKFKRGKQLSKGKIQFSFIGNRKDINVKLTSKVDKNFLSKTKLLQDKDSIYYWHSPVEKDSLVFYISNATNIDTSVVKLTKKKIDSLLITKKIEGTFHFDDSLVISANNPIIKIDTTKVVFTSKDSINIPLQTSIINTTDVFFDLKPSYETNYKLTLLPGFLTDIFNQTNDTLSYKTRTVEKEEYGEISVKVNNPKSSNTILQIVDENYKIVAQKFLNTSKTITFINLKPKTYYIRAIVDINNNKLWDTGSYTKIKQPEKVIYLPKKQQLRANWLINETISIN